MRKIVQLLLLFVFTTSVAFAQERTVSGKVSDENGDALVGASVVQQGTSNGTVTDIDGNFKLSVPDGSTLVFSFVGYTDQSVAVGSRTTINVSMELDVTQLSEVVVTALFVERDKKALGYSVTEVDGESLTTARETNFVNSLAGRVAGVNVTSPASGAGGSARINIRGISAIGGSGQPLYVIDGVPMDNSNLGSAGMWGGSDGGDGTGSLNPDDIETISVLKGATASALYGSRAQEGVILITTKSGKKGQGIGIELNSNYVFENIVNLYDFQTEYGVGNRGAAPASQDEALDFGGSAWGGPLNGQQVPIFDGSMQSYSYQGDNLEKFYQTGTTFTNTLSLSGGGDNQTYRFSASNLDNKDVVPNAELNRKTFSLNTRGDFDKIKLNTSLRYSIEDVQNRPRLSDAPGNANYTVAILPPSWDVEWLQGDPNKLGAADDGTELAYSNNIYSQNPYWAAHQFYNQNVRDRLIGSTTLRADITDWLYVQGRAGMDFYTNKTTGYTPYGTAYQPQGSMSEGERRFREVNLEMMLGATKEFGDIGVNVFVGGNRMRNTRETLNLGGSIFNIPFYHNIGNLRNQSRSRNLTEFGINSYFGQAEVSWNETVYVTGSLRQDSFSTLGRDNNQLVYPGVSTSIVLSEALDLPSAISFAKLRGAWTTVSGGYNPYQTALTYGLVGQGHQGAVLGRISNGSIPNPLIQPSLTSELEIGLDMRLLDGKITADLSYYNKQTTDGIIGTGISATSGYGSAVVNIGELVNRGFEALVTANAVENNDFRWDVTAVFSHNDSEVTNLGTNALGEPTQTLNFDESRTRQERVQLVVGQPYAMISGYVHQEINGEKVYTAEGFPVRGEFKPLAQGTMPTQIGLTNSFRYKDLSLSFLIDWKTGGSIYSGTNVITYGNGMHKETLEGRESGITVTGVDTDGNPLTATVAAADVQDYYGRYNDITENFIYDASFIKLRQLIIGYNLPQSILSNTPIKSLTLSVVGRNLWLIKSSVPNVDPEAAYNIGNTFGLEYFQLPPVRSFGFNLNAKF